MKTIFKFMTLVFFIGCGINGNAQFLKKLGEKVENTVERKIDKKTKEQEAKLDSKIEEGVDKVFDTPEDAINEEIKKEKNNKKENKKAKNKSTDISIDDMMGAMQSSADIEVAGKYHFNQKVLYTLRDKNQNKSSELTYYFGTDKGILGVDMSADANAFILYDMKQNAMIMFSNKDKTMQVISMDMFGAIFENSEEEDQDDFTFKKVPGSKKIAGYNCDKYELISENLKGEFWFSSEVDIDMSQFSKAFLSVGKNASEKLPSFKGLQNGFMIEMNTVDEQNNFNTSMTVREISKTNHSINTSQYKRMQM